jgi:hypothetical protein
MRPTDQISGRVETAIRRLRLLAAASCLLLAASRAQAQFPGDVPDTFRLYVGGMYAWFGTDVTFQPEFTPGGPITGEINMEDIFGLADSRPGFSARGYWNIAGRLYFDFGYTGFFRKRTETISADIPFGDVVYTAGASVEASMDSNLPYVDFRWNFVKNDAMQFGLTLGAAYPILEAEVTGEATVVGPGGPVVEETVTREAKISTPVPLLGLLFDARLGERVSGGVIFNGIFAPVHPYVGSVFQAEAHVDWFVTPNFGVGGAFDYTNFNIKKEDDDDNVIVDFSYHYYGPRAYVILTF